MRTIVLGISFVLVACGGRSALWFDRLDGSARSDRGRADLWRDNFSVGRNDLPPRADLPSTTPGCPGDRDCDGVLDANDCAPDDPAIGCSDFYLDQDGDGYGTLKSCRCKPGAGYTATKGGDCLDSGPRAKLVHPGQTSFFSEHRGDGSYDYDCDGKETPEHGVYSCDLQPLPSYGCTTKVGFKFAAACGVLAEFVYACFSNVGPFGCELGVQLKSQGCR